MDRERAAQRTVLCLGLAEASARDACRSALRACEHAFRADAKGPYEQCLLAEAFRTSNPTLCDLVPQEGSWAGCVDRIAEKIRRADLCRSVECVRLIAVSARDPAVCQAIRDPAQATACRDPIERKVWRAPTYRALTSWLHLALLVLALVGLPGLSLAAMGAWGTAESTARRRPRAVRLANVFYVLAGTAVVTLPPAAELLIGWRFQLPTYRAKLAALLPYAWAIALVPAVLLGLALAVALGAERARDSTSDRVMAIVTTVAFVGWIGLYWSSRHADLSEIAGVPPWVVVLVLAYPASLLAWATWIGVRALARRRVR